MVNRHVVILNPAASVKGVKEQVIEGKTPEIGVEPAFAKHYTEFLGVLGRSPSTDEIATPPLVRQAKRRLLDEFECLGLDAVRRGEELVWPREAPTRMFGAIRAKTNCLHCHANAKEGDLRGAFTYYLTVPVDQLNIRK
jgi:hypothetical protein